MECHIKDSAEWTKSEGRQKKVFHRMKVTLRVQKEKDFADTETGERGGDHTMIRRRHENALHKKKCVICKKTMEIIF